jgi:hypothetical protein
MFKSLKKYRKDKKLQAEAIEHWEKIYHLTPYQIMNSEEFPDADGCAFCIEYLDDGCQQCPIARQVSVKACLSTPYQKAFNAYRAINSMNPHFTSKVTLQHKLDFGKAVREEINFLKNLTIWRWDWNKLPNFSLFTGNNAQHYDVRKYYES